MTLQMRDAEIFAEGKKIGIAKALAKGCTGSFAERYTEAFADGYEEGFAEGYEEGFAKGFALFKNLMAYMRTHEKEPSEEIARKFQCEISKVEEVRTSLYICKQVS